MLNMDDIIKNLKEEQKYIEYDYSLDDLLYKHFPITMNLEFKYETNYENEKYNHIITGFGGKLYIDKRIYDINSKYTTINKKGLAGKYSIYIKINNTIYKTNNYIKF